MKFSVIPYIGSLLACFAGFLNEPPLMLNGKMLGRLSYILNLLHFAFFILFVLLYGQDNDFYIIPLVLQTGFLVADIWDETNDVLTNADHVTFKEFFEFMKCKTKK